MARFGRFFPRPSLKRPASAGPRPAAGRNRDRGLLAFEALEGRQLLAANMAEIVGLITVETQGDGNPANNAPAVGAQVRLYRDGGDGVFGNGGGDDQVAAPLRTVDAAGRYRFEGLAAGRYFVQAVLPPSWQLTDSGVRTVLISSSEALGATGRTIDAFDTMQSASASPPLPASQPSVLLDANVIGGERDLFVELTQGTDPYSSVSLLSAAGLLRLSSDSIVTGNARIAWDGVDNSALGVNPRGLGGIDLTAANGNTMTGIALTSGADHPNALIKLRVYKDANNWSEFLTQVPQTPGGAATQQAIFNFADQPVASQGTGADFRDVGALTLTFEGVSAVDGQISLVNVVGLTTKRADFVAQPRLSLGDHVWTDINDNGLFDSGEPGIDNVLLRLYADTDGNNLFTPNVDLSVGTTTTAGGGKYLFSSLSAGSYIVMVEAANFQSGGPLAGLRPSGGAATDPDDNRNGDNNGLAFSSQGVVSQAITLAAAAEPTNDGDSDANSNLTLDFGFFGFDLVVDKTVDRQTVYPGDTLTYVVSVSNTGPSTARAVDFRDWLPAGVEFLAATTNRTGIVVTHQSGLLAANLGDMKSGESVLVTVTAKVRNTAKGVLLNEAAASAANELVLTNNRDSVSNPVTPRIDLAIDKRDSADPAAPGQNLSYTLKTSNLGPSAATGVVVVDTLPASGVSFVSASVAPASVAGREVRFNLGNLAAGAEQSITIVVAIAGNFSGELINQARVFANEVETTLANNQDEERTQIKAAPGSLSGYVYVDRNNDGVYGPTETPISGVVLVLEGSDFSGRAVNRTATTNAKGQYRFDDLSPGTYAVRQSQPQRYRDGKDTLGENGDGLSTQEDGLVAPDLNDEDNRDADAFEGIVIRSGFEAVDYNFGELSINVSKRDFVRTARW